MQRMLQNMPSADFIGKALGIEQSGVESLLQQGKGYLAQQLTQRGVLPGATLAVLPQPGGQGAQARRPPPPQAGAARPMPQPLARRPAMPYQSLPGPQQQGQPGAGPHQPRPGQPRPFYGAPQGNPYAQQAGPYPTATPRPAFPPGYGQGMPRPGSPAGAPLTTGNAAMPQQSNAFVMNAQPRPQLGPAVGHPPPRQPTPPPALSEDDKKFLNKPALQQLLKRVGGPKVHMKPSMESALGQVAEDLVGQALSFGCSMARRRQGTGAAAEDLVLQPADLAAFLEQTWQLHVPGFGGDVLRTYKRPAASELHKTRAAAVRRAQATSTAGASTSAEVT